MKKYSQLGQDLNIINFYEHKKKLFFLDIGAYDGIKLSNTYLLEKKYEWNGICSEPLPSEFNKLKKVRNVICDNNAVFSESNKKLSFSVASFISGITNFIDCHTKAKKNKQIIVNTITLNDLLIKYNAPEIIHYMSLDTEGTELEILKSVDYSKYKFLYINLEHNYIEPRRSKIRELLLKNDYLYKGENKFDDDYIHKSLINGKYMYNDIEILIEFIDNNKVKAVSKLFDEDIGILNLNELKIIWSKNGESNLFYNKIKFNNKEWCKLE
jgi:FkbM family methyltransferase